MNTQDETIIREEQNDANGKRQTSRWQTVSIGGVTGIAMGMAATRAYDAFAAGEGSEVNGTEETADGGQAESTAEQENTATEVHQAATSQGLSFSDAFAAARAEVGPGGVFMWHGRLYNTYTAAEWNAMSDEQKDEFADNVQPLLAQQTVETQHVEHHTARHLTDDHTGGADDRSEEIHVEEVVDHEPEVHFLGVDSREINGQTVNVGIMTVDNDNVAFVDVDNDQVFDIRLHDDNQNGEIDDEEVEDVSDRNLSVDDFRMLSMLDGQAGQTGELEQASNAQEDLAPGMPDYMNDADLGTI